MKIYFATSNPRKVADAQKALEPYGITVIQIEVDLSESRSEDPAQIALEKAKQSFNKFKKPVIVEDSGFFIKCINGFPMTHIKFSLNILGIKNILKMMEGAKDRSAEWRMSLVYVWGKNKNKIFTFVERGEMAKTPRPVKRKMGSDYWRLYIPKMIKNNKALSEMEAGDLEKWEQYYRENNQFKMFGKWFAKKQNRELKRNNKSS